MKTSTLLFIATQIVFSSVATAQKTFTKDIQFTEQVSFNDMILTKSNDILIATSDPEQFPIIGLYLSMLNQNGNLKWSKKILYNNDGVTVGGTNLIPSQDYGFIALCHVSNFIRSFGDLLIKADSSGNILWAKEIDRDTTGSQITPIGVAEAKDGSIYVVNQVYDKGVHIQKLDKNATPLWSNYTPTDTLPGIFTRYESLCATNDGGLIISTVTSEIYGSKYYSHLLKFSADGEPEWICSATKNSFASSYLYSINTRENNKVNILYFQDSSYKYIILNPLTAKAEAYDIESPNIFDLQSFFRTKKINPFNDYTIGSYAVSAFTNKLELIKASPYQTQGRVYRSRIEKFDSLGRICPDYVIPISKGDPKEIRYLFTKSSFKLKKSPITLVISDAYVTTESVNRIKTICEGNSPQLLNSYASENNGLKIINTKFNISPNPTTSYLNIQIDFSYNYLSQITITDINGNILKSFSISMTKGTNNKTININNLAKGIYIIKCSTADGFVSQKIIKQ